MSKVQTRRGVTLNRKVFERLKAHAAKVPVPVASLVERLVEDHLDRMGRAPRTHPESILRANACLLEDRAQERSSDPRKGVPNGDGRGHGLGGCLEV